jgi:hypothetical protein
MTARERITGQVLAVMREAERRCADPLTAARRAFATLSPLIIAEIHHAVYVAELSERLWAKAQRMLEIYATDVTPKPPKPRWRWFCSPG